MQTLGCYGHAVTEFHLLRLPSPLALTVAATLTARKATNTGLQWGNAALLLVLQLLSTRPSL
jgi:hypothetical protein